MNWRIFSYPFDYINLYPKKLGSGIPRTLGLTANKPPEYLFSLFDLSCLVEIDVMKSVSSFEPPKAHILGLGNGSLISLSSLPLGV